METETDMFGGFTEDPRIYEAARERVTWNLHSPIQSLDSRMRHKYREHAGALVDLADSLLTRFNREGYDMTENYLNESWQGATDLKVAFVVCLKFSEYQDREDRVAWWLYERHNEAKTGRVTPLPVMERMYEQ